MTTPIGSNVLNAINGGGATMTKRQSDELRENFLTLLTTQLQNQDPLNPMENHEMTSQLAQISTVSGVEQLNETLQGITAQMEAGKALQASGLIGQGVMVPGDRVLLEQDETGKAHTTPFGIELARPADNVTATITSASGQVVRRVELGSLRAGVESFSWDGATDSGETAMPGSYRVVFAAKDADGNSINVESLNYAMVNGVMPSDRNGEVRLDLGAIHGQIALNDIRQIL